MIARRADVIDERVLLGPAGPPDAWLPLARRRGRLPKAPASLYIRSSLSPLMRISASLLDAIGDPNDVAIHVNPRRRQLRLLPIDAGRGRRIARPDPRQGRPSFAATGIPEALGIVQATAILRFDAEACEEHITLTMRGEP